MACFPHSQEVRGTLATDDWMSSWRSRRRGGLLRAGCAEALRLASSRGGGGLRRAGLAEALRLASFRQDAGRRTADDLGGLLVRSGAQDKEALAICPMVAFFNRICVPNLNNSWQEVKKKTEVSASEEQPAATRTISVTREPGQPLGIRVESSDSHTVLKVVSIGRRGNHGVFKSPVDSKGQEMRVGDRIISVNGVTGDADAMTTKLKEELKLEVSIERRTAKGIAEDAVSEAVRALTTLVDLVEVYMDTHSSTPEKSA